MNLNTSIKNDYIYEYLSNISNPKGVVHICHGNHLTEEGKALVWKLKQGMNRQRQLFCWKHLNK